MVLKKDFAINLLLSLIPVTFIGGNLLLNLNIILIILFSLFCYGLKIFKEKFSNIDKAILIFFLYIIVNGIINNYFNNYSSNMVLEKSVTYLRFLILYFVVKFLVLQNKVNYKFFFFSIGAASLFVAVDLIFQYIFGQDIFGFKAERSERVMSGPFGDEHIAGSFLQRFFIFTLYFVLLFVKFKKIITQNFVIYFLTITFIISAFIAGNRFPMLLLLLILTLFFLFEKQVRSKTLIFLITLFIFLSFNFTSASNKNILTHYSSFIDKGIEIKDYFLKRINSEEFVIANTYIKEIETGFLVWEKKKFFGGGIKSFYPNCSKIKSPALDKIGGTSCSTHPHNYYLNIATDLGLVGLIAAILIFAYITVKSLRVFLFSNNIFQRKILLPFFLVFVAELFPIKTSGSFFTSANSIFLFIIIAFIVGLIELKKKEKYER